MIIYYCLEIALPVQSIDIDQSFACIDVRSTVGRIRRNYLDNYQNKSKIYFFTHTNKFILYISAKCSIVFTYNINVIQSITDTA